MTVQRAILSAIISLCWFVKRQSARTRWCCTVSASPWVSLGWRVRGRARSKSAHPS